MISCFITLPDIFPENSVSFPYIYIYIAIQPEVVQNLAPPYQPILYIKHPSNMPVFPHVKKKKKSFYEIAVIKVDNDSYYPKLPSVVALPDLFLLYSVLLIPHLLKKLPSTGLQNTFYYWFSYCL